MRFKLKPADTFIWNLDELIGFLAANQNKHITIDTNTEGCCATAIGLYSWLEKFKFASVTIETSNILEHHRDYCIKHVLPWKFVDVKQTVEDKYHCWDKSAVFGTLYGRPLWHRLGLAAYLLTEHAAISSVGLAANTNSCLDRNLFELTALWENIPEFLQRFLLISDSLPLLHKEVDQYTPGTTLTDGYTAQTKGVYPKFLIDVVAETFTSGNCFFITEKTVRPMLLKKPFIVFASRDYLLYLRQMGFRTFGDFWDETYDGFAGVDRFNKIISLIDTLAKLSKEELEKMYWDMQYTLDHNYDVLQSQSFKKTVTQV